MYETKILISLTDLSDFSAHKYAFRQHNFHIFHSFLCILFRHHIYLPTLSVTDAGAYNIRFSVASSHKKSLPIDVSVEWFRSFLSSDKDGWKRMRTQSNGLRKQTSADSIFFWKRNNIWAFTLFTLNLLHLNKVRMTQTSNRNIQETVDNDNSCSNNVKFNWFTILLPIYDFPSTFTTISVWICFSSFYVYLKCI